MTDREPRKQNNTPAVTRNFGLRLSISYNAHGVQRNQSAKKSTIERNLSYSNNQKRAKDEKVPFSEAKEEEGRGWPTGIGGGSVVSALEDGGRGQRSDSHAAPVVPLDAHVSLLLPSRE